MSVNVDFQRSRHRKQSTQAISTTLSMTLMVLLGAYFLLPLYWLVVSTTKTTSQLFNSPMLLPAKHLSLLSNLQWLSTYQGGEYWHWFLNSVIIAGSTAILSTLVCAMGGYAIAKYKFWLNKPFYGLTLGALMVPGAALVIPVFFIIKSAGLINTYPGVIMPMLASPFGLYFMTVYAREAMPSELIESGRVDGAGDYTIFARIGLPLLAPGLTTLFLISFIGAWNNYFLPLVLLNSNNLLPITVGLGIWVANLNSAGTGVPLYPLVIIGSLLSVLPMLILFPFLRKFIVNGIALGGVKG